MPRVAPARLVVDARARTARSRARARRMATRAVFDAGVPVESLPWGDDVRECAFERGTMPSTPGASSSTPMYVATPREQTPRGIVIVCHTAIGPWETFIRSCCDGLASRGFAAAAPDMYGVGECVFDAETRRERRSGEENRANFGASRVADAVRAVRAIRTTLRGTSSGRGGLTSAVTMPTPARSMSTWR